MRAAAGGRDLPDQGLPAADLAAVRLALQVLPIVLGVRGAGDLADSAYSAGWSWPAGGCFAATPGVTEASIQWRTSGCSSPRDRLRAPDHACPREHLPAADRRLRGGPEGLPQRHRRFVGLVDRAADVLIRALLLPLTLKQFHSMQRLQRLQPEMKAIQNKYKEDKQRQQQELMKFYKENQVNPLGSCLPLVAQLPVFISLFYMLRSSLRVDICPQPQPGAHLVNGHWVGISKAHTVACGPHDGASFLFIPDLTNKATGAVLVVLIVLYVGTQLASSLMMSSPTMDRTQRQIMLVHAAVLRDLHHQLPGGRDRVLDHHEQLDDRAAVRRQATPRACGAARRGRRRVRRLVTGGGSRRKRRRRRSGGSDGEAQTCQRRWPERVGRGAAASVACCAAGQRARSRRRWPRRIGLGRRRHRSRRARRRSAPDVGGRAVEDSVSAAAQRVRDLMERLVDDVRRRRDRRGPGGRRGRHRGVSWR